MIDLSALAPAPIIDRAKLDRVGKTLRDAGLAKGEDWFRRPVFLYLGGEPHRMDVIQVGDDRWRVTFTDLNS